MNMKNKKTKFLVLSVFYGIILFFFFFIPAVAGDNWVWLTVLFLTITSALWCGDKARLLYKYLVNKEQSKYEKIGVQENRE